MEYSPKLPDSSTKILNSDIENPKGKKNSGEHPRLRWDPGLSTSPYGFHRNLKLTDFCFVVNLLSAMRCPAFARVSSF